MTTSPFEKELQVLLSKSFKIFHFVQNLIFYCMGQIFLCGISKTSFEIPHKISCSWIERCAGVKFYKLLYSRTCECFCYSPLTVLADSLSTNTCLNEIIKILGIHHFMVKLFLFKCMPPDVPDICYNEWNTSQYDTLSLFYLHGLTLIPAWIRNHMPGILCEKIIHPFPNFNSCTVAV